MTVNRLCVSACHSTTHHLNHCRDRGIRQRLTAGMPVADLETVAVTASRARPAQLIRHLQPAGASAASGSRRHYSPTTPAAPLPDPSLPSVVVVPDAEMPLPDIMAALQRLPRHVYMLLMPPMKQMAQLRTVASLASLFCAAIRSTVPPGPLVIAGVGAGSVVAHEMAVQLQRAGGQVRAMVGVAVWLKLVGRCLQQQCVCMSSICRRIDMFASTFACNVRRSQRLSVVFLPHSPPASQTPLPGACAPAP